MKRRLSLRTYMLVLVLAVMVPFASQVAYLVVVRLALRDADQAREHALMLARQIRGPVIGQLTTAERTLTNTSVRPGIRAMQPTSRPPVLDRLLEKNTPFASLYVVSPAGQIVHFAPRPPGPAPVLSFAQAAWFADMLRRGQFTVGPPGSDPLTGMPVLFVACPIREEGTDKVLGGLCAGLDLARFGYSLTNSPASSNAVVTILDAEGTVVTCSENPQLWAGKNVRETETARLALAKPEGCLTARGKDGVKRFYGFAAMASLAPRPPGFAPAFPPIRPGRTNAPASQSLTQATSNQQPATNPRPNWHVLVGIPYSIAFAPTRTEAAGSVLLALGVVGVIGLLLIWLRNRIARPIQALAHAAQEMAKGRWDLQLPLAGPAEVAAVAQEFNSMTAARKQAEDSLRAAEEKFRVLVEHSLTGVYIIRGEQFVYANPRLAEIFGYTLEEFVRVGPLDVVVPEDRPMVQENFRRRFENEIQSLQYTFGGLRKDGTGIVVEVYGCRAELAGQTVIIGTVLDITDRRRKEEALRRSESLLRSAFDNAPFEFWVRDKEGRCIMQNPPVAKLWGNELGWRPEDAPVPPETLAVWKANNRRAFAGEVVQGEIEYLREGQKRFYYSVVAPVRVGGEIWGILGYNLDITGLKLAEKTVRAVSGRLLNLQEEERRRIARDLHDTTGQNLTAMMMNLSLLKSAVPLNNTLATKALEECFGLTSQCMQEIRTFSYLLHPPVLDELGLARSLHDYAVGFQQRSGIRVELDLVSNLGTLSREIEVTLFRVVQESLGNIHRHSGSRTAAIRMWRDANEVWLEVQDAGKGIPADQLRANENGTAQFGVGIAGMKERMQQLGGRLDIRSGSRGTTIQAIVPVSA